MSTRSGKHSTWRRVAYWAIGMGAFAGALYAAAGPVTEAYLRRQLEAASRQVCAVIDHTAPPVIAVDLLNRSVRITGLVLLPAPECAQASFHLRGRFDTLEVTGISIGDLLFRRTISVRGTLLRSSDLQLTMIADSLRVEDAPRPDQDVHDPWYFDIRSFTLGFASITWITASGDTMQTGGDGIRANGKAFRWLAGADGPVRSIQHFQLDSDGLSGTFASGYSWALERLAVARDGEALDVYGLRIGPVVALEAHSAGLAFETDVIQARIDTIQVSGLDLNKVMSEGLWSARKLMIASGEVNVLRDKTLKDGPSVEQPLLTRSIRRLPVGSGVDSIKITGLDVRYRERGDAARGYADIPFGGVEATISGARNHPADTTAFVVQATCIAFEAAPVSMVLRSLVQDSTDRFVLDASIGTMPFQALNRATGPLLDIRCTEGRIDSVIMHMDANRRHASGSVYMNYHGLKMSSGGKQRKETMNRLETILLNTLVKDDHLDSKGAPREGPFSFPRRQDRAVFNYMWSGLREGTKAVLLPEAMTP